MTTHEGYREALALHALGSLEEAERREVEAHLLVPLAHQRCGPQGLPEHVEGLAQGSACALLVELWPKNRKQTVAAVISTRSSGGEVGEEGEAPWLSDKTACITPVRGRQVHGSEQPELDHELPLSASERSYNVRPTWCRHGRRDGSITAA